MSENNFGRLLKRRVAIIVICLVSGSVLWLIGRSPSFLESVYAEGLYPYLVTPVAVVTGWVPFSLAETGLVLLITWSLLSLLAGISQLARGRISGPKMLFSGLSKGVALVLGIAVMGYIMWGLNYARPALVERLGWQVPEMAPNDERVDPQLLLLCQESVRLTNSAYQAVAGTQDLGQPTGFGSVEPIDRSLNAALAVACARLGVQTPVTSSLGRAKPVAFSSVLSHLGITGFYSPWTAEANYNRDVPSVRIPMVIAHEKSHQLGLAAEDEANFLAFVACSLSSEAFVRYSGYLFAQQQLLAELLRQDPKLFRDLAGQRWPGVVRDLEEVSRYWAQFEGFGLDVGEAVNDSYLRLHGVEGGTRSYDDSLRLLLLYSQANGGLLRGKN